MSVRDRSRNPDILRTPYHFSIFWDWRSGIAAEFEPLPVPKPLKGAAPQRIAEFVAGRFCAAKAIEAMNPTLSRNVGIHLDGSPHWPEGVVGSITHTDGYVSAAVARSDILLGIGIDSEKITNPAVLSAAKDIVLRDSERHWLSLQHALSEDRGLILLFSAKESIYKCLQPLVKCPMDYASVQLEEINVQDKAFSFRLTRSFGRDFPEAFIVSGRFEFDEQWIHTGIELPKKS